MLQRVMIFVLLSLFALPCASRADDADKAIAARRASSELARLAAQMKPGSWAELKTVMPAGLWSSPRVGERGGLHIAGWTDDAHWDSRTGQLLYMGMRQTRQFIAYSETTNSWRIIPLDRDSDNPVFQTNFGHIYGNNAFDPASSRFYHRYGSYRDLKGGISYFDVVKEKWTRMPSPPDHGSLTGSGMCIEYFSARKGLVILGRKLRFFSDERQQWQDLGDSPVDGYHSLFRHNPFREEVLLTGGNNARQIVARIKKDGSVERLKDLPEELGVRSDKLTVDPVSGRYLIMHRDKKLYEFDSDSSECRLIDDFSKTPWPFNRYDMPVVAFIPEYGITIWAATRTVHLYKHNAAVK